MDEQFEKSALKVIGKSADNNCNSQVTFELLNDDCLLYVFEYLNIFDATTLALTCTRLKNFVNAFIYPKLAGRIEIQLLSKADELVRASDFAGMENLIKTIRIFGKFVEHLSVVGSENLGRFEGSYNILQPIKDVLLLCPNLLTLNIKRVKFDDDDEEDFNFFNFIPPNVTEMNFIDCCEIEDSKIFLMPEIERITFTGVNNITGDFVKPNRNLSSLSISFDSCEPENLLMILNLTGNSIQDLRLSEFSSSRRFESIVKLIVDKLPRLQNLAIEDDLSVELTNSVAKLPHLKSLKINCRRRNVISLLQILSERGTIQVLEIENFAVDDTTDFKPLVFSELHTLRCPKSSRKSLKSFLKIMIKSEMPAINALYMQGYRAIEQDILALFESKKTLKTMNINYTHGTNSFALLCGIIEILKADRNRPCLNLYIALPKIGEGAATANNDAEQDKFLLEHRDLVRVNENQKSPAVELRVGNVYPQIFYRNFDDIVEMPEIWADF